MTAALHHRSRGFGISALAPSAVLRLSTRELSAIVAFQEVGDFARAAQCDEHSSDQLMAIIDAAGDDDDRALLGVLGLMGLCSGEARSLLVGDLRDGHPSMKNGGAGTDTIKTGTSRRPHPEAGHPRSAPHSNAA